MFDNKFVEYSENIYNNGNSFKTSIYTKYIGYHDNYAVRQINIINGIWYRASENYRQEYLADQPLTLEELQQEGVKEISKHEFEAVWQKAINRC